MNKKIDYYITLLVGFITGVFMIPTAFNLGLKEKFLLMLIPLVAPIVWIIGMWIANFTSRWIAAMNQFSKFLVIGFMNTALDFGILNLLSSASGVTTGLKVGEINIPGFTVAIINSYFWNKLWVFGNNKEKGSFFGQVPKFAIITTIGLILNSGIIILLTTFFPPPVFIREHTWLNISKALATVFTLFWNFFGYRLVVFKKEQDNLKN